jgi:hypothetical protein
VLIAAAHGSASAGTGLRTIDSVVIPAFTRSSAADSNARQNPALSQQQISWNRFGIAGGSLLAAGIALHIYQANAWWKDNRTAFHVIDDNEYKANFDKFGHTFGGYYSSHFFDEAFSWSGMDSTQSAALGAACGALWETYIEVEDGFGGSWGFSRGDFRSDLMGATFYFLRSEIKPLQALKYKWSYFPSVQYLENKPDIPGQTLNFIEDYGGQEYWMSLDVHSLLPDAAKAYWPNWLNLAVGVGGSNLDATTHDEWGNLLQDYSRRHLAWYLSLDYDITKLWPESDIGFLNFIRRSLDYWHFPSPAVRITPETRFFILFPLRMSIG